MTKLKSTIVAILALLPTCALAQFYSPYEIPPKEYDREYTGRLHTERLHPDDLKTFCKNVSVTACSLALTKETCFVWIVDDDTLKKQGYTYDLVYRHERAHCLGWKHPQ